MPKGSAYLKTKNLRRLAEINWETEVPDFQAKYQRKPLSPAINYNS